MPQDRLGREVRHAKDSSGHDVEAGLARQLSELAREMQAEADAAPLLQRITETAVSEVDGAEHAGISLIEHATIRTEAATSDLVGVIDEVQYRAGQGPCLSSLREQVTVRSDDLEAEGRWPNFAAAASKLGVRSMLSVQLFVDDQNLGALNLYASTPDAFTEHDESVAMLLAAHAAIAIKGSDVESNLRVALDSRDTIGQGKGILMERYKISSLDAFQLLVLTSQRTHRKLRDVADALAATGELNTD